MADLEVATVSRLAVTTDFTDTRKLQVWRTKLELTRDGFITASLKLDTSRTRYPPLYDYVAERTASVPPALYLDLLRLNLTAPDRIVGFCSDVGPMYGTAWGELIPLAWVDPHLESGRVSSIRLRREIEEHFPGLASLRTCVEARSEAEDEPFFHPDEFRVRARLLRDATRTWLAASGTRTWTWALEQWESADLWSPTSLEQSLDEFVLPLLSVGLTPFHPRVEMVERARARAYPLYNVICLQLARDIQAGQEFVDCPNCGVPFSKEARAYQDFMDRVNAVPDLFDGADLRQRSKDVLYCSRRCANAASSRKYRERQQAKPPTESETTTARHPRHP